MTTESDTPENLIPNDGFKLDAEALEFGDKLFGSDAVFVAGAPHFKDFPKSNLPEVAFSGRSNVGKSSLINALLRRKGLARTSNTPGRTQHINLFNLGDRMQLADLPGYGYAKVSRSKVHAWNVTVSDYLRQRHNLSRLCVLIDSRHGILEADEKAFKIFDDTRTAYVVVLTKVDKIKRDELAKVTASVEAYLKTCKGAFPIVYPTSSAKGWGLPELRAVLAMVQRA